MANLAVSGVTLNHSYQLGGTGGKDMTVKSLTLVLAAMGTATNKIQASILGYTKILRASNMVKSDNTEIVQATPSADGSLILLTIGTTTLGLPADFTGTYTFVVEGY
jgi:hypothetical protein